MQNVRFTIVLTKINIQFYLRFPLQTADPVVKHLFDSTEEGQKVSRNNGDKLLAVFQRVADPRACG